MRRRPILSLSLLPSALALGLIAGAPPVAAAPPTQASASETGTISGRVKDSSTGAPIEDAIVILSCACLSEPREAFTNAHGVYAFPDLPAGVYTIQVLAGKANVSKIVEFPRGAKFRSNFTVDPDDDRVIEILVTASPSATPPPVVSMEEAKLLPVGANASRDFMPIFDPKPWRDAIEYDITEAAAANRHEDPYPIVLSAWTVDDNRTDELERFAATAQSPELAREVGLGPRAELFVVDRAGAPIHDAELIVSAGRSQPRARLRTGTDGRAVINARWDLGLAPGADQRFVQVLARTRGVEVVAQVELESGPTRIVLPITQSKAEAAVLALDLVLVVDTTGGMSDELDWLTTTLRPVVDQVLAEHPNVDARLGVVAYHDEGTRRFELSDRHHDVQAFLTDQTVIERGDTPDAVDRALTEATSLAWRHDRQAAKVILLVGDAPPHDDRVGPTFEAASRLREAGVSIYPIASSGVDDRTKLVFRSLAADTGAQHLSLPADSHIRDDYDVDLLRDALARILAAELRGEPIAAPKLPELERPARAAFQLHRSLLDDGDQRMLLGGPKLVIGLP